MPYSHGIGAIQNGGPVDAATYLELRWICCCRVDLPGRAGLCRVCVRRKGPGRSRLSGVLGLTADQPGRLDPLGILYLDEGGAICPPHDHRLDWAERPSSSTARCTAPTPPDGPATGAC